MYWLVVIKKYNLPKSYDVVCCGKNLVVYVDSTYRLGSFICCFSCSFPLASVFGCLTLFLTLLEGSVYWWKLEWNIFFLFHVIDMLFIKLYLAEIFELLIVWAHTLYSYLCMILKIVYFLTLREILIFAHFIVLISL